MNVESPRKTTSGCSHHASRRAVSPKARRLRTPSYPMLLSPCRPSCVLKPKPGRVSNRSQDVEAVVKRDGRVAGRCDILSLGGWTMGQTAMHREQRDVVPTGEITVRFLHTLD